MIWIAPSEKDTNNAPPEQRLGDAANQFRANSSLIFRRFAAQRASLKLDYDVLDQIHHH